MPCHPGTQNSGLDNYNGGERDNFVQRWKNAKVVMAVDQNKDEWTTGTSKEYLTALIEHLNVLIINNDKRYTERFDSSEKAVAAALAAQKELTNAAFASSEKAIVKAEDSQRTYNQGHNDLSRKMEEQYKALVPISEHRADLNSVKSEVANDKVNMEKRMDRMAEDIKFLRESRSGVEGKGTDKIVEAIGADIRSLRDSRGEGKGKDKGVALVVAYIFGAAGFLSALLAIFYYLSKAK
jgi:hypothetical protein